MFPLLIESIFELIIGVTIMVGGYHLIFAKSIAREAALKQNKKMAANMAIVKLHSNDSADIMKFLNDNAQYLSADVVEKLADHLEGTRILNEEPLKQRFEDLENHQRVGDSCINCGSIAPAGHDMCITCDSINNFKNENNANKL